METSDDAPVRSNSLMTLAIGLVWATIFLGAILLAYQYGLFERFFGLSQSENSSFVSAGRILMNLSNADTDTVAYVFDTETRSLRPFDVPYLMPHSTADEQALIGTGHIDDDGTPVAAVLLARSKAGSDDIL